MTETQTPNPDCLACAGTGFVPPFMDDCTACIEPLNIVSVPAEDLDMSRVVAVYSCAYGCGLETDSEAVINDHYAYAHPDGDDVDNYAYARHVDADGHVTFRGKYPAALTHAEYTAELMHAECTAEYPVTVEATDPALDSIELTVEAAPKTSTDTFAALVDACEAITVTPDYAAGYGEAGIYSDPSISYGSAPKKKATKPATAAQTAFLGRLVAERDLSNPFVAHVADRLRLGLTARETSSLIDALMKIPAKETARSNTYDGICKTCGGMVAATTGEIRKVDGRWQTFHHPGGCLTAEQKAALDADKVTEPGLYRLWLDSDTTEWSIYRVRKSRGSTRLYAEKVIPLPDGTVAFAYQGRAISMLTASNRLSWMEARLFGVAYGACVACGRTLSDPRSLVQGYGNTCAKNYGWPTVGVKEAEAIIAGILTWDEAIGV